MSKKVLVVLDPGHRPNYNKGVAPGYYEGNKMYDYSLYEKEALEAYGVDVIITRKREKDLGLYTRGQVAVKNATGYDEVVFLSNHTNAAGKANSGACGVVVYRSLFLPGSVGLGKAIINALVGVMRPVTGITYDRGVVTRKGSNGADYYGVIRGAVSGVTSEAAAKKGPVGYAFIVEHGFHDNATECAYLNNNANLKKMAEAEAKAVAEYFGLTKTGASKPAENKTMYRVRKSWIDAKSQVGAYEILANAKAKADETGLKVFDVKGKCVYDPNGDETFKVRVKIDDLNIRKGPGTIYDVVDVIDPGIYTIVEVKAGNASLSGWGKLKSGIGWISLDYAERL